MQCAFIYTVNVTQPGNAVSLSGVGDNGACDELKGDKDPNYEYEL